MRGRKEIIWDQEKRVTKSFGLLIIWFHERKATESTVLLS